ncbi:hypothetical protein SKAU_G00173840 [Synaphobranchus kaupii]|uniref:Uncharacterized protein n=1 Tax=Synaphobranchus kaupii TaxID=118154 RepID=A0A9Q1FKX8_SYNKA|nr:hypothetical protein SKAU_G00173840 [Synaphobranchus kaupii]
MEPGGEDIPQGASQEKEESRDREGSKHQQLKCGAARLSNRRSGNRSSSPRRSAGLERRGPCRIGAVGGALRWRAPSVAIQHLVQEGVARMRSSIPTPRFPVSAYARQQCAVTVPHLGQMCGAPPRLTLPGTVAAATRSPLRHAAMIRTESRSSKLSLLLGEESLSLIIKSH